MKSRAVEWMRTIPASAGCVETLDLVAELQAVWLWTGPERNSCFAVQGNRRASDDRPDGEGRFHSENAWKLGKVVAVDTFEVDRVPGREAQDVIGITRHQETLHDFAGPGHGAFEILKRFLGLAGQRDFHENVHVPAEFLLVQKRDVFFDDAGFLQRAHAPQTSGRGKPHLFRQVRVGDAAVALQNVQDLLVEAIEFHFCCTAHNAEFKIIHSR